MKSVTFIGTPSGDGECFCWSIDLDTHKEFHRGWEEDIKYRQNWNIENGYPENQGIYSEPWIHGEWQLYPTQINNFLDLSKKKYKITVTVEEIGE